MKLVLSIFARILVIFSIAIIAIGIFYDAQLYLLHNITEADLVFDSIVYEILVGFGMTVVACLSAIALLALSIVIIFGLGHLVIGGKAFGK